MFQGIGKDVPRAQRTPENGKSLYKTYKKLVFLGKLSPRIPRLNTINTMVGAAYVRGTPVLVP